MTALSGIRACMFDAYGTLFDFASAAARCPGIPEYKRAALTTLWRDKQLQYTWLRTLQDRYVDFWQVTTEALDFALDSLDLRDAALREQLLQLHPAFPALPIPAKNVSGTLITRAQGQEMTRKQSAR